MQKEKIKTRRLSGQLRFFACFMGLCVVFLSLVMPQARAQTESILKLYTVFDIHVDVSARTAAQARDRAMAEAETRAFWILLNKIAISEDLLVLADLEENEIRNYVRSMEILKERSSRRRYIATLNITYEPPGIRVLLGTSGIRFSEITTKPLLVLPILEEAGTEFLFESGNHWLQAWRQADRINWLTPFILPRGDFEDRTRLTSRNVGDARKEIAFTYMRETYGVDSIAIIRVRRSEDQTGIKRLDFSLSRPSSEEIVTGTFFGTSEEDWDQLFLDGVAGLERLLDDEWKRQTLTAFGEFNELQVRIKVDRIEDWLTITNQLKAISIVRDVSPVRLALPWSDLKILYLGAYEQLQLALEQANLRLIRIEDGLLLESGASERLAEG